MIINLDINTSFVNTLICLSSIIYHHLDENRTIDELYDLCQNVYSENKIELILTYDDIVEALLLLFSVGKIELINDGKVAKTL